MHNKIRIAHLTGKAVGLGTIHFHTLMEDPITIYVMGKKFVIPTPLKEEDKTKLYQTLVEMNPLKIQIARKNRRLIAYICN